MRQGGADIAKRGGKGNLVGRTGKGIGRLAPADQLKAEHISALPLQQPHRPIVIGMVRAGRINHPFDPRRLCQRIGQQPRRVLRPVEPQVERMQPPFGHPAIPRAGGQPPGDIGRIDRIAQSHIPGRHIAQRCIRMARQQLGDRMDHDIGPMIERAIEARRGECVIHYQKHPGLMRQGHQPRHVGHPDRRVRNHLNQNHPCVGAQSRPHRRDIGRVRQRGFDPKARQVLRHQPQGPAIKLIRTQHMVTAFQAPQKHRTDCTHPRSGDDPTRGPLEHVDLGGQHIGIGMAFARIGIAGPAGILRIQRIRISRGVYNRWLQRRDHRARSGLRPVRASDDAFGRIHPKPPAIRQRTAGRYFDSFGRWPEAVLSRRHPAGAPPARAHP